MDERLNHGSEWNFSTEELTNLSRHGLLPSGYLDARRAWQQALHARLNRELAATFAAAASDPIMLARLNRPL